MVAVQESPIGLKRKQAIVRTSGSVHQFVNQGRVGVLINHAIEISSTGVPIG